MSRSRLGRWLGSAKNLAGCVGGLIGLVLYLTGVVGAIWPLVVVVLYAAGALLAPPERVRLVADPAAEAAELRTSLAALAQTVSTHAGRLPESAVDSVRHVVEVLDDLLGHPIADAGLRHRVLLLARTDLPLSVEGYLNLPRWFAARRPAAAAELLTQLELLSGQADRLAEQVYATEVNRQADHTRYLRDRDQD
ncbi:hypothetical protein [Amycolatopsis saalfeldensis]|uniref:5-bromo-4-chloroindolyl phosphate hydrolysis protein n=1 Tax=Amycolatopsis saalfeldensis TaxID=394193 RepID=A0A1H8YE61_9PSEU|nr:hypothetical protein [Amycolatopsis saalfeldensis]SEP50524.1 hypothetical protein SAMN04489732_114177 [Amycolatopsis saalfeldensis]